MLIAQGGIDMKKNQKLTENNKKATKPSKGTTSTNGDDYVTRRHEQFKGGHNHAL